MHPAIARLSLEDKARFTTGTDVWNTHAVPVEGIESVCMTDGPHGVRMQGQGQDHLGLNGSLPATAFPTAAALGSSWNVELLEEIGRALAREALHLGADILLGPGVNMKRSPLCGRNFEYFGEDPLHSGVLGAGWVRGLQSQGVGASVKHFAANNQETERLRLDVEVDERTLREIYLPAFEKVVMDAHPATVMCAYNAVNGAFAAENHWLLTEVLRKEWGFDGYVVSDWGATHDRVRGLAAGLDLEMPSTQERGPNKIRQAIDDGTLQEAVLDVAVDRIIRTHQRIQSSRDSAAVAVDWDAHHALARRAAAQGAVLLTNDGDLLPMSPHEGGTIAVIGEFARTPRYQGAGSSHVNPTRLDDALSAIRAATDRPVEFAAGFTLDGTDDIALRDDAVALADRADVVVLFLGLPDGDESEGYDRDHLQLPAAQRALLQNLTGLSSRIAVVLSNGGVLDLREVTPNSAAILEMWLAGQASGSAIADVLFGHAEPGGRLAETIPAALTDTPAYINWPGSNQHVRYGERIYIGYRWYDMVDRDVAFPFGHGLGYTTFEYTNLQTTIPNPGEPTAAVQVTVTNTGTQSGSEIVQLYVQDPIAGVDRPVRELRGFARITLEAGASAVVHIALDHRAFAYWDHGQWVVEPGEFIVEVGASSRDIRLRETIELHVPVERVPLNIDSTIAEWMADPVGAAHAATALKAMGEAGTEFTTPEFLRLIGQQPLRAMIDFSGVDGREVVAGILKDIARKDIARPSSPPDLALDRKGF